MLSNLTHDEEDVIFADESDELTFAGETEDLSSTGTWKVLIVDDEEQVHKVTQLALNDFSFDHKSLTFISAYSGKEAKQLIQENPDIALIFLDVIMESDTAGLEVAKYIREELHNSLVRIILRTGQPGQVPESQVIVDYDINDYKSKTELTQQKLLTSVITALRTYKHLEEITNISQALQEGEAREKAKSQEIENVLAKLKYSQVQLIQAEKMSSLGQLVAGIAHEINNPINFISGNLSYVNQYVDDILHILDLYQQEHSHPSEKLKEAIEEIELDYLIGDLPRILASMNLGSKRICQIVSSLKNFSRLDESQGKLAHLCEGIDSTLLILHNRIKPKGNRPEIEVVKNYQELPEIECYPGQLNQVFMNLIANAIDAIEEGIEKREKDYQPQITITTEVLGKNWISIRIMDNGIGMKEEVKQKLFEPMFTTKPAGKGTGLGLMISHSIIEEKHRGKLTCCSQFGEGTTFEVKIPLHLEISA